MAKKQILLINDRLVGGGAEQITQRIAADLAAQGAALTVYAPEGTREELAAHYPAGTRFRRYPFWEGESRRFSLRWFWQRGCRVLYERVLLRLKRWDCVAAMKEGPCMRLASRQAAEDLHGIQSAELASVLNAWDAVGVTDGSATGIEMVKNPQSVVNGLAGKWYTLDGRLLEGQPTKKGLYIHNGNKIVVK